MAAPGDVQGWVVVGMVVSLHGVLGELRVDEMTDFSGRFVAGEFLFIGGEAYCIQRSHRPRPGVVVLKLEGVDTPRQAEDLKGKTITVPRDKVPPLPEGHFYHFQLVGMEVFTSEGECLGHITGILPTGSNDVYIVSLGKRQVLIPALDDVVREINVEAARMTVDLPEGLR